VIVTPNAFEITLAQYVRSINLILDEHELALNGFDIGIYFDAAEIRDALLGAEALAFKGGGCDPERFKEPQMLVRMLLSAGWLGPVRLLPPHQSELLSLITFDFPKRDSGTFTKAVDCLRRNVELPASETKSVSDLVASARQTAETAMRDFKLSEACRSPWHRRLSGWTSRGILDLETIVPDYSKIIETPEFSKLERVLTSQRPDTPRNNLSDAAAVMTAVYALDRFRDGASRHIPLLYLPPGLLRRAVVTSDMQQKLSLRNLRDRPMSIIRDWAYLVVRATMRPASTTGSQPPVTSIKDLRMLRDQLKTIDTTRQRISEILVTLNIGDSEVTERVDTLFDLCFYTNVWLAYKSVIQSDSLLDDASDAAHQNVNHALQQVRSTLTRNVREYTRLGDLWQTVRDAAKTMREHVRSRGVMYVRAYGGFRFAPPVNISERAQELLDDLVFGSGLGDFDSRRLEPEKSSGISRVILLYERAKARTVQDETEIGMLAIVLWCLGLDTELLAAVSPTHSADWLSVLRAAAELRSVSRPTFTENVLDRLKRAINERRAGDEERGRVAIAIGYLSFHMALLHGYEPFWLKPPQKRTSMLRPPDLVSDAATYARQAVTLTPDPILHTYALNQSLYYLVASGVGSRAEQRDLADQLLRLKSDPRVWDYRYDDTIARYFMWASLTTETHRLRVELADSAKQHIDDAFENGHADSEVSIFRSVLENYRDDLMTSGSQGVPLKEAD
jgi:hypothetical protein